MPTPVLTTPSGRPVTHGSAATYSRYGCKCDPCAEAKTAQRSRNWQRHGERYNRERQQRRHAVSGAPEPRLPLAPLLASAERQGLSLGEFPQGQLSISLSRADELCCKTLLLHPSEVFGRDYWDLP